MFCELLSLALSNHLGAVRCGAPGLTGDSAGGGQPSSHLSRLADRGPQGSVPWTRQLPGPQLSVGHWLPGTGRAHLYPMHPYGVGAVPTKIPGALWPHLPLTLLWLSALPSLVAPENLSGISMYLEGDGGFFFIIFAILIGHPLGSF